MTVAHWRQMGSMEEALVAEHANPVLAEEAVAQQRRMGQQRQMAQHASPVVLGIWGASSGEFHDGQTRYLSNGILCS